MRFAFYFLAVLLLLTGCGTNDQDDQMLIKGRIIGLKKGRVYLQRLVDTSLVSVDSAVIEGKEEFTLRTGIDQPDFFYIYLRLNEGKPINDRFSFFGEPGEIELTTRLKTFGNEVVVIGSANQEKLVEYNKLVKPYIDKNLELISEQLIALQNGNDSLLKASEAEQKKILAAKYLATINFAINHKEYEIAPYLAVTEVYNANLKYLDTIYSSLPLPIKESKYGKELGTVIERRRKIRY